MNILPKNVTVDIKVETTQITKNNKLLLDKYFRK